LVILGKNQPINIQQLQNLFSNFEEINFHLIFRESENNFNSENYNNIFIYNNCLTSIMLNILNISHYVLCFNINKTEHYALKAISGSIHLSFSFGCKLILPEVWNFFYNFKSCLTYKKNQKLTLEKEINIDSIYDENNELIQHRNLLFNKILSY
jgi:hypothetical protein